MKVSNPIDFNGTQLLNALLQVLGSAPGSPLTGQLWYNSADGFIYYRNASTNVQVVSAAQLTATRLDQFAAPTTAVSLNSQKITNLADGTATQDAATYGQVIALINGLRWKDAVRVATTGNITLSGTQTIDGISVVAGDRVAVIGQTTGSANGIYVAASGAWTRSEDANTAAEVLNMSFFVSEGTTNGNRVYNMTTDAPITLNTTALVFAQIGGGGTTYSQGTGITISGSVISADTAVLVRKVVALIGNGSLTSISVTHSLGTKAVTVGLRKVSTDEHWIPDVVSSSTSAVTLAFATAPATNEFEVVIHG